MRTITNWILMTTEGGIQGLRHVGCAWEGSTASKHAVRSLLIGAQRRSVGARQMQKKASACLITFYSRGAFSSKQNRIFDGFYTLEKHARTGIRQCNSCVLPAMDLSSPQRYCMKFVCSRGEKTKDVFTRYRVSSLPAQG